MVALLWQQGGASAGEKRKNAASGGPEAVPAGLGPYREELVRSVEAVIGTTLPLLDGDTCPSGPKQPLLPVAVVSNLLWCGAPPHSAAVLLYNFTSGRHNAAAAVCSAPTMTLCFTAAFLSKSSLEGYHIAEAIGCSLIMASPYQVWLHSPALYRNDSDEGCSDAHYLWSVVPKLPSPL